MSEDTSRGLREALERLALVQDQADRLKQACLDEIAAGVADRIDSLARAAAQAEPEATMALGTDGVRRLRAELSEAAEELADDLRSAVGKIKWPEEHHSIAKNRAIHSALFEYLHGARVDKIAEVLKRHGFNIHDDNAQRAQGLVYPQSLYDEARFGPLTEALTRLAEAKAAVTRAKKADDESIVDEIWGNGPKAAHLPGSPSRDW